MGTSQNLQSKIDLLEFSRSCQKNLPFALNAAERPLMVITGNLLGN